MRYAIASPCPPARVDNRQTITRQDYEGWRAESHRRLRSLRGLLHEIRTLA
jgi:hypothetical protein